jgi:GMP synthase-like glutamine amidotransferase
LVVQNDPDKTLGRLEAALTRAGVQLDVRPSTRDLPGVLEYDGLVVLPGLADPVDKDVAVVRARNAIHDALQADLPILGLCLGGQLLVQVLGGAVYRCRPERGFREVSACSTPLDDPLLGGVPERFLVFHAHAFAFDPPADAAILLTNDVCVQACRHGETWAFQCHPEVTSRWVAALVAGLRGEIGGLASATTEFFRRGGVAPDQLERDGNAAEATLRRIGEQIGSGFANRLARAP